VTLSQFAELARGLGGASFSTNERKKSRNPASAQKTKLDLDELVGGKVTLSKEVRSAPFCDSAATSWTENTALIGHGDTLTPPDHQAVHRRIFPCQSVDCSHLVHSGKKKKNY
jgi:hypothetical protein